MTAIGATQGAGAAATDTATTQTENTQNDQQTQEAAEKFMSTISLMVFNEVWKIGQENAG